MISSFQPIVDDRCRILILGTMPGAQSLMKQEYYGNKQNAFWRIIFTLFNEELSEVYEEKKAFLLKKHIALWDVLKTCEREGSGDAEIENPMPNDFSGLFKQYPGIGQIYFNGGNSEKFYRQYVISKIDKVGMEYHKLPSTSPAYTAAFEDKFKKWQIVRMALEFY